MSDLVIIFGSSSGIGLATASYFLNNGRSVFGVSRTRPVLICSHPNYHHYTLDITCSDEHSSFIYYLNNFLASYPSSIENITVLLFAGTNNVKSIYDYSSIEISDLISLNLTSQILLVQELCSSLRPYSRVNFILASSIWSSISAPYRAVYGATKAALESFVRHMTAEFCDSNFYFYILRFGFVDTPLTRKTVDNPIINSKLSRLGTSKYVPLADIFATVCFLEQTTSLCGSSIELTNGITFL